MNDEQHGGYDDVKKYQYVTEAEALDLQLKAVNKLPNKEGWPFSSGMLALSVNSALGGLIGNSFHRRMMRVTSGLLVSTLPLTIIPFISTAAAWHVLINIPILLDKIDCPICIQLRGATLSMVVGGMYPILISAPLVASLAIRENLMKSPHRNGIVGIWKWYSGMAKHMKLRFVTFAVYQFALGGYVATKAYQAHKKTGSVFEQVYQKEPHDEEMF